MKPTATKCIDGKRHTWKVVAYAFEYGIEREHKWCRRCGSYTEFYDGKRCEGETGKRDYIEIPLLAS